MYVIIVVLLLLVVVCSFVYLEAETVVISIGIFWSYIFYSNFKNIVSALLVGRSRDIESKLTIVLFLVIGLSIDLLTAYGCRVDWRQIREENYRVLISTQIDNVQVEGISSCNVLNKIKI